MKDVDVVLMLLVVVGKAEERIELEPNFWLTILDDAADSVKRIEEF